MLGIRSDLFQYALIILGIATAALFGVFWWRELYPEYKIYQNDYIALEEFRASYTHEPPPDFRSGIKQIVMEREDKGPPEIDRCISCHVALQFPHFSPTRIARDINGNVELNTEGRPVTIPNEDYVWERLDKEIAQLEKNDDTSQAESYRSLKTARVGDRVYDVTKVLRMHPLMGRETRPFEYHPIEEYGCVSCHSGNGRGLTTEKAHGPVFDGEYEEEFTGPHPQFTEQDPDNDPAFARIFNHKPGHSLLFQTTPILVGALIQSKCIQCHQNSAGTLLQAIDTVGFVADRRARESSAIREGLYNEKQALLTFVELKRDLQKEGLTSTLHKLQQSAQNYALPPEELQRMRAQIEYLLRPNIKESEIVTHLNEKIAQTLGSEILAEKLQNAIDAGKGNPAEELQKFLVENMQDPQAQGTIFAKLNTLALEDAILHHVQDTESSFEKSVTDEKVISAMVSDVDRLTTNYHQGEKLYISQACYACHRIAGMARGGVGPELTRAGKSYPWFLKESMVWPQADLATSTMPNYKLDHEELEDLMTFLLGQMGESKGVSSTAYKIAIQEWEAGKKMPWEKAIPPDQLHNLDYSMKLFAEQGCAACHRLKGFESNVGYRVEKESEGKIDFENRYGETEWFKALIPEMITGFELVQVLEKHKDEIDQHIVDGVRKNSILERIDQDIPGQIESLYTPFKYAMRAKNTTFADQPEALKTWQDRVQRVLMMFIQEYGLGRLVGPRPNWSGVYRSDEWLMEHFRAPTSHIPRSIMPVFPFDDSKFYALTYMLDHLAKRNRDEVRAIWDHKGFNSAQAFELFCAQCHGNFLQGNGPVSEWIYPIPKNLRNADFLRNLTKERVVYSLIHGVKGTPMPPWGEVGGNKSLMEGIPVLSESEAHQLADWIFSSLPGGTVIRGREDVPKWQYKPEDALRELDEEGNRLESDASKNGESPLSFLPKGQGFLASLKPMLAQATSEVDQIFDVVSNPASSPDKNSYFIKKKYYTEANLEAGKAFFNLNCAVCHGNEADGTGARASAMKESKPRMLVNLDWGYSRDDLRLLRSIKYGVDGTAMNPWGDLTSSLQRMQLVMYIRSLTRENRLRQELTTHLYEAYERDLLAVEEARIHEYAELTKAQVALQNFQEKRQRAYASIETGAQLPEDAASIYQKELEALSQVKKMEERDQLLKDLKVEIAKERDSYQSIALNLIAKLDDDPLFSEFLSLIKLNQGVFFYKDDMLKANFDPTLEEKRAAIGKEMVAKIDSLINHAQKEKVHIEGQIASPERTEELNHLNNEIATYTKLKIKIISGLEEAVRARKAEEQLWSKL